MAASVSINNLANNATHPHMNKITGVYDAADKETVEGITVQIKFETANTAIKTRTAVLEGKNGWSYIPGPRMKANYTKISCRMVIEDGDDVEGNFFTDVTVE